MSSTRTSNIVLDAYAWVEYLIGSENGKIVEKYISNSNNRIYTNNVTLSETISVVKRRSFDDEAAFKAIVTLSHIYDGDLAFHREVGLLHAHLRKTIKDVGLADAFVIVTAQKLGAKIITGDSHFKNVDNVIMLR